jgi:MFS family permease
MNLSRRSACLLAITYLGFISLGLPDGTFGLAWTGIYHDLGLPIGLAGTIIIIGTLLSGTSGFMSGRVVSRFGTGPVVLASCLLTGCGLLAMGFAHSGLALYLIAIPLGIGAGAVDSGLNSFVARHYSGRHMNWLHACWGVGATTGPLFMGYAITSCGSWRVGYWAIGGVQLTLAALFLVTLKLWKSAPENVGGNHDEDGTTAIPTTKANSPAGYLSMMSFALYGGVEAMTGLWIGTILIVGHGFSSETASLCTASFYAAITGGRILVGFVVDRFGNRRLIGAGLAMAFVGSTLFVFADTPAFAFVSLILIGGGFAPVYPCLMHEVPHRFAPDAVSSVVGWQTGASYIGVAVIPLIGGWVAQVALPHLSKLTLAGTLLLFVCIRMLDKKTPVLR